VRASRTEQVLWCMRYRISVQLLQSITKRLYSTDSHVAPFEPSTAAPRRTIKLRGVERMAASTQEIRATTRDRFMSNSATCSTVDCVCRYTITAA